MSSNSIGCTHIYRMLTWKLKLRRKRRSFPLYIQGRSRCDLENLNIAWFLNSFLEEFLVSIVRLVVTEYCYELNHRCRHEMDDYSQPPDSRIENIISSCLLSLNAAAFTLPLPSFLEWFYALPQYIVSLYIPGTRCSCMQCWLWFYAKKHGCYNFDCETQMGICSSEICSYTENTIAMSAKTLQISNDDQVRIWTG